jgi:hypothetical protein
MPLINIAEIDWFSIIMVIVCLVLAFFIGMVLKGKKQDKVKPLKIPFPPIKTPVKPIMSLADSSVVDSETFISEKIGIRIMNTQLNNLNYLNNMNIENMINKMVAVTSFCSIISLILVYMF